MKLAQLFEGGWSDTVTQNVSLTPRNVKKALALLPKFEKALNSFLKEQGLDPVSISIPVGSTSYVDRDEVERPEHEYGDADVLMVLPQVDGKSESKVSSAYQKAVAEFIKTQDLDFVYKQKDPAGKEVIFKIGEGEYVQVDLIKTFSDSAEWARYRTTPEYKLKGALIGYLYSSLADVLHLSINQLGVQAKKKAEQLVKFKTLKADEVVTISKDFENFGRHIAEWTAKHLGAEKFVADPLLKNRPGMRKQEVRVADLADVVKGIALSLEKSKVLGKGHLAPFRTAEDVVAAVKKVYLEKAEAGSVATKFDKAQTDIAKKKAEETKNTLINKSKELSNLLDL